jgi:hypothetical protein
LQIRGSTVDIRGKGGLVDLSNGPADLRLATGQAIEDGGGTKRIDFISSSTDLYDSDGKKGFTLGSGIYNSYFRTVTGENVILFDDESNTNAVKYNTSASAPGTLELTNANLDASGSDKMTLPHRSSDPSASPGDMWYRTDLD